MQRYARHCLLGVDADALTPSNCTYTTTPDSNSVLDRHGPIVVGAGFSGHGFKHVPAVGQVLADLAVSGKRPDPMFSLSR
ncbi:MAG: FAD-dependent oxidoreductase [Mycobacteriaceae bacterium]